MAAQVLSGSGNVSYTNSTGQNVRVVINYLKNITATGTMTFQGVTVTLMEDMVYGKSLAHGDLSSNPNKNISQRMTTRANGTVTGRTAVPVEIALSNGETLSISNSESSTYIDGYNMIIIPEAG